jgi:hypothetical protein
MFHVLCGIAAACTVSGQPAEVVKATTVTQSPTQSPQPIVKEQRATKHHRRVVPNPPLYVYQGEGCDKYNCIGPSTAFRLPNEIPYPYYEQQYRKLPPAYVMPPRYIPPSSEK